MPRPTALAFVLLSACSDGLPKDHGPAPDATHQAAVRAVQDRVLGEKHQLSAAPAYRFAAPVKDRVARWHWEPQDEGQPHAFGYRHGWRVDFWVTPHYEGYPPQPESQRMAFFGDGRLRGVFAAGGRTAPLELDRWAPVWVDPDWKSAAVSGAPPR